MAAVTRAPGQKALINGGGSILFDRTVSNKPPIVVAVIGGSLARHNAAICLLVLVALNLTRTELIIGIFSAVLVALFVLNAPQATGQRTNSRQTLLRENVGDGVGGPLHLCARLRYCMPVSKHFECVVFSEAR